MTSRAYPTSGGSRSLATTPATENATVVQRWLDAGPGRVRQDQHPGVRRQGRHGVAPVRSGPQPLEHRPHTGRLLGRGGGCGRRRHRAAAPAASDGGGSIRIPASAAACSASSPRGGWCRPARSLQEGMGGAATQRRDLALGPGHRGDARRARGRYAGRPLSHRPCPRRRTPTRWVGPPAPSASGSARPADQPQARPRGRRRGHEGRRSCSSPLGHHVEQLDAAPFDDEALAKDFLHPWFV